MRKLVIATLFAALGATAVPAQEVPKDAPALELDLCRQAALVALRGKSPEVKEVLLDPDASVIAKADTKVGDTPVKAVVLGEGYLGQKGTEKPYRYVCLIGEANKVVLTFFTRQ